MSVLDDFFRFGDTHKEAPKARYIDALERRDYAAAVVLLRHAVRQEDATAMGFLGVLTALGRGIEKNAEEACAWFRQAAVRGDVPSQVVLGICMIKGLGVPKNHDEAAYWLFKAGVAGNQEAIKALADLAFIDHSVVGKHFTEDQLCNLVRMLGKRGLVERPSPSAMVH